jgi:hypothetical protein
MLGIQIMMDYKPLPIRYDAFDALMKYYQEDAKEVEPDAGADTESK